MNASQRSVRPFQFKGLPVVRRDEIDFFHAMARITPAEITPMDLPSQLFDSVSPYIKGQFQWQWTGHSQVLRFKQLDRYCLSPTLLIHIVLLPLQQPILLELDPRIAAIMVDCALGGTGQNADGTRPFSEIERGVLTFLVLKAIHQIQVAWGNQVQLEFRLVRIEHNLQAFSDDIPLDAAFFRKEIHCSLHNSNGFIRLHIPTGFVGEIVNVLPEQRHSPQEYALYQQRLQRVADTPLVGLLRVGMVDLSEAEFMDLLPGDIIVIRECSVNKREDNGLWEGQGILQFSERPNFAFRCRLQNDPSHPLSRVSIEEVVQLGEPPMIGEYDRSEYKMDELSAGPGEYDESMDPQGENYDEMGPVLSDVPVPLIVELGRVECRARDILYMRVGQILELHRSPHEPLHLVVNNQIIGRGELVEVEGQIGIRIIEIAG